jgi:hypothetical protein
MESHDSEFAAAGGYGPPQASASEWVCNIPGHQGCDPWNCRWAPVPSRVQARDEPCADPANCDVHRAVTAPQLSGGAE